MTRAALMLMMSMAASSAPLSAKQSDLQAALANLFATYGGSPVRMIKGTRMPVGWPPGLAIQMSWHSNDMEFSMVSGSFNETAADGSISQRTATVNDTFLFGSGSKPFTGAAIMRLVEQGVLALSDPVSKHIDPVLPLNRQSARCKTCPTTWDELFPGNGSKVTIGMLISMESGLKDYDTAPGLDDYLLWTVPETGFTPLDFIDYIANETAGPAFDFEPGTHVGYTSTSFIVAGLILSTYDKDGQDWTKMQQSDFYPQSIIDADFSTLNFYTDEPLDKWLTAPGPQERTYCDWNVSHTYSGDDAWIKDMVWELGVGSKPTGVDYFSADGQVKSMTSTQPITFSPAGVKWTATALFVELTDNTGCTTKAYVQKDPATGRGKAMGGKLTCGPDAGQSFWGIPVCTYEGYKSESGVLLKQNSTILGGTCGNVVSTTRDVARWYWDLNGPAPRVVNTTTLATMETFKTANQGWAKGSFQYGTGLMRIGTPGHLGSMVGHGGSTYGFTSCNGVYDILNASISIVSNGRDLANGFSCSILDAAALALGLIPKQCGAKPDYTVPLILDGTCQKYPSPDGKPFYYSGIIIIITLGGTEAIVHFYANADCTGTPALSPVVYPVGECLASYDPNTITGGDTNQNTSYRIPSAIPGVDMSRITCNGTVCTNELFFCSCKHNGVPPEVRARRMQQARRGLSIV